MLRFFRRKTYDENNYVYYLLIYMEKIYNFVRTKYLRSGIIILLLTTNMKNIFMILIEISDMDKSDYLLLVNSAYLLYRIIPTSLLRVKNQFEICLEDKVEIARNYFFSQPSTISKSTI